MNILIWIFAGITTVGFAFLIAGMASAEGPYIPAFLFGLVIGLISQAGLLLSATSAGSKNKPLTSCLMLPSLLIFVMANYESITFMISDKPVATFAPVYVVGLYCYLYAYFKLFWIENSAPFKIDDR